LGYLDHTLLPVGLQNQNIHLSVDVAGARIVDNYEGHPITVDNEAAATTQLGGIIAKEFPFSQSGGAFNPSFFGNTNGNVCTTKEINGHFREPLEKAVDLSPLEVRVRAAEVFQAPSIPANATGFRVGAEDSNGTIAWVDVDDVGGLPRPFDRTSFDALTKTMLSTFRFPGHCFQAAEPKLRISSIRALHLGLNRGDKRPLAFDDLGIVKP
jgi:hypothetical protein